MTEENKTTAEETAEEVKETEAAEDEVTEATPETQAGSEEVEETKEKKLFGKKKKDKKDEKIEELTDRVKRQMAEFENFRKRTEKEKAGMYAVGAKDVIEKILPVVDNFERGLDVAVGNEFNPDFHNAVMHVEDETVGENIVVEEFQKGYMYKDSVVRHSMVKVAN